MLTDLQIFIARQHGWPLSLNGPSLWITQECTKKKKERLCYGTYSCKPASKTTNPNLHSNRHHVITLPTQEEKCHNGFNQLRPKCRVHSLPEAFLSLIRGASSCLQPKPAHRHDGRPAHKHTDFQILFFRFWQQIPPFSFRFMYCRCKIQPSFGIKCIWCGLGFCDHGEKVCFELKWS